MKQEARSSGEIQLKTKKGFTPELLTSCFILGAAVAGVRAQG
jgi:hypothetical protein